jgi:hypothetical protein
MSNIAREFPTPHVLAVTMVTHSGDLQWHAVQAQFSLQGKVLVLN